jgi:hypothetical protein
LFSIGAPRAASAIASSFACDGIHPGAFGLDLIDGDRERGVNDGSVAR